MHVRVVVVVVVICWFGFALVDYSTTTANTYVTLLRSFAGSVLPAPIIGSIFGPPALSAKCIVVAALAAAQSAYFLALAEGVLARATDAVAIKARSAAVCDT